MNRFVILLFNTLFVFNSYGQTKLGQYARMHKYAYDHLDDLNHDYSNLKTIKVYDVDLQYSYNDTTEKTIYLVNNKAVDKKLFDKFEKGQSLKECTPCILETYDEFDSLLRRAPTFMSTEFDWFKEYYPTGKIKQTGQFAKIKKKSLDLPWLDYAKDGQWVKYNMNGDTLYSEFWQLGEFVKQVPEQKNTEVWKVDVIYKGNKLDSQLLTINDLNQIEIISQYKNSNRDSIDITVELFLGVIKGGMSAGITAPKLHPDSLKNFNFNKVLIDTHVLSTDKLSGTLTIRKGTEGWLKYIPLYIKNELPSTNDSLNKYIISQNEKILNDDNYSFYLINSANSNKKIKIKNNVSYTITYEEATTDTLIKTSTHYASGYIKGITDSTIDISSDYESIFIDYKNGTYSNTEKVFTSSKKLNINEEEITLPIQSVKYVNCKSGGKQKCAFGGAFIIVASVLTFVAAPLVSIDYINGGFNSERFRKVALVGGISLSVGIPFSIIGRSKNRRITSKSAAPNSEYWYVEPLVKGYYHAR